MAIGSREISVVLKLVGSQFNQGIGQASQGIGGMISKINVWKVALVGAAGALFALAKGTAEYADGLLKTSQQMGVSIGELQGLIFAAEQSGSSFNSVNTGLRRFSQNLFDAVRGTGEAKDILAAFDITLNKSDGTAKTMTETILEVSEVFAGLPDGVTKAALAQKLFGRSGAELIPLLNEGADGIQAFIVQSEALGQVTQAQAEDARDFNDRLNELERTFRDIKNTVGAQVIPVFTEFFIGLRFLIDIFKQGSIQKASQITFERMRGQIIATRKEAERLAGTQENANKRSGGDAAAKEKRVQDLLNKLKPGQKGSTKLTAEQKEQEAIGEVIVENTKRMAAFKLKNEQEAAAKQIELGQGIVENAQRDFEFKEQKQREGLQAAVNIAQEEVRIAELTNATQEELAGRRLTALQAQQAQELALFQGTAEEKAAIMRRQEAELIDLQDTGLTAFETRSKEVAESIGATFATSFFNPMREGFLDINNLAGSLEDTFNRATDQIIQDFIRIQTQKAILGATTGGAGAGAGAEGGGFASLFAGFFAAGGTIPSGKFGIVGENGPEIAEGGAGGTNITPLGKAGLGGVTVNVSIVAKDVDSFRKSAGQIGADLATAVGRARRNL